MTDPRVTPSNGRVAHVSLEGIVEAMHFVRGRWMAAQKPIVNITDAPGGTRVNQLLFGEFFLALENHDGFFFGQAQRDGYVGYVAITDLTTADDDATHWVIAPATHLYPKPNLKEPASIGLFFGSCVYVNGGNDGYHRIKTGHYVPEQHLTPVAGVFDDPMAVADLFLGTPYLWGGISRWGIDCSGLVQTAFMACGVDCPRDTDQQNETLGEFLHNDDALQRGDLIFWDGHVGMMSNDETLLHANAHHMAVVYEPLAEAEARIHAHEFGPIIARKRVHLPG